MPPHVRRGGTRGRSNTPRHPAQARAGLSVGRSAPRTQSKFAAFDEFCKRLFITSIPMPLSLTSVAFPSETVSLSPAETASLGVWATFFVLLTERRTVTPTFKAKRMVGQRLQRTTLPTFARDRLNLAETGPLARR